MLIIDQQDKNAVILATKALQEGKIIIIPTDTIYGLAVDGSNPEAVERLYSLKKRDKNKPIAIFLPKLDFITEIFELSNLGAKIAKNFLPGKITIVAKLRKSISNVNMHTHAVHATKWIRQAITVIKTNHRSILSGGQLNGEARSRSSENGGS